MKKSANREQRQRTYLTEDVYKRQLNELAKKMDRSRPTAATSNQDGELNQITDLIVWAQNIGWDKGRTEDLEIWLGQLRSGWNQLRSGICYGEAGQIEQQDVYKRQNPH